MSETQAAVRVVPSGQIYRQLFDAQAQLIKTLDKTEKRLLQKEPISQNVPIVHEGRETMGKSLLTDRPIKWLESQPNDGKTENPVSLRHSLEKALKESREPTSTLAAREVRSLADTVDVDKQGSDIIERISESRRLRHEAAVEDLHQDLTLLANELEPQISGTGVELLKKLADNDAVIEDILGLVASDEALQNYTLRELEDLWSEVEQQSTIRREWIKEMSQTLNDIEMERQNSIKHLVKTYAKNLEQIAFLMAPDVQRLIERESQIINQTLLSNQRAYADLLARLMKTDIERDKNHRTHWEGRVEDWKRLNTEIVIQKFTEFMDDSSITDPPIIKVILTELYHEQQTINQRRINLFNALRSMKPPSSTKSAVYRWNKELASICQEIERLHTHFLSRLHKEYERICKECLDQVETCRVELLQTGVCSDERVQEVVESFFLPQLGERQKVFENHLDTMDVKSLENLAETTAHKLRSLFKYAQGAAHLWDVHEINLAKRERELQEKLEECRHNHDNVNQQMEANLDIVLDRLRQESSKESLQKSLEKAVELLDSIKESYDHFHIDQQNIVQAYPDSVQTEVLRYDAAVCKFYEVDRIHPSERQKQGKGTVGDKKDENNKTKQKKVKRRTPQPHTSPHPGDHDGPNRPPSVHSTGSSVNVSVTGRESSLSSVPSPVPMAVKEVLSTSKGTTFYVLTVAGEQGLAEGDSERTGDAAFMTEGQETGEDEVADYIKNVIIPESLFQELRKVLRIEFLNHLEDWTQQAKMSANSVVAAKLEELNSELDLRLHLHNPRCQRIEKDIHNVRGAELLLHQDRVTQHSKGVSTALNEIKTGFTSMQQEHEVLVEKFQKQVDLMEGSFETATKSATLLSLSQQVSTKVESHMEVIRVSLRKFRQYLDQTLQMLRESNARFIKSFKLFSDGGNFSPEEVDTHKKKLEKLANKIDSAEGFVMADLEGMETRRLEQATEIANKFEDRFKNHLFDLTFIEKLTRWLTNTQVKIKGEVAESNSKAQDLMRHLNTLERRVDACKQPNLDKEQITSDQLLASLPSIFTAFEGRATVLNCRKAASKHHAVTLAKVGFSTEGKGQTVQGQAPVVIISTGQKSKVPVEDSAVLLIKNILVSQKVPSSSDGDDSDKQIVSGNRTGTNPASLLIEDKQSQGYSENTRKNIREREETVGETEHLSQPRHMIRKKDTNLKFDPKYYIFGEKLERDKHFMAVVKRILQDSLDGLLSTADLYYKQKGSRHVTRPQAIHDSFETSADVIVSKLQSYYNQADEYHNQCLQEFREQLEQLEMLVAEVPPLVIADVLKAHLKRLQERLSEQARQFYNKYGQLEKQRSQHKGLLKPSLGHPQNISTLKALCDREEDRRQEYEKGVHGNVEELNRVAVLLGEEWIQALACVTEELLKSMDAQIVVDDVEVGRVDPQKLQTSALLRRKRAGLSLTPDEGAPLIQRGSRVWQDMICNPNSVKAPKKYLNEFDMQIADIDRKKQEQISADKRWSESWQESVDRVKKLY
ncbi:putative coiled-coil domain-containing protein [Apostichopus japonicus]|uniref:Putative coiled-coil domain-containing protein n=1 Tax=Stichopus japonicus TaxID=307972 RepID=A0A2G8JLP6_STIJA|nr:putative coiled-coil domain-containing protein [Apostichopus japonicus]